MYETMANFRVIVFTCAIFVFSFLAECQASNIEGYYWREYAGTIPSDALPGGSDHNGDPIYIGQILHGDNLLTAKLYINDNKGYYGLRQKEYTGTKNIKVLCTQLPERFIWVKTKHDEIHLLTNHHLVLGGHEPGYTMYIGRAYYKLETAVGKVSTGNIENSALYITHDGKEIQFRSFEILTYNPHVEDPVLGYYWREYAGKIPSDALRGGSDYNGNPIYIGQILHEENLLTAKLYIHDNKGYYGLRGTEYTGTKNIKVLCTQHPEKCIWVKTKTDEIHLLTDHYLVLGGHEPGLTMYIGRVYYKLETAVGKVSTGTTENLGLYITNDGDEINFTSFEILTYNPHVEEALALFPSK